MNRSEKEKNLLLQLLSEMAQGETVDYVVRGMQENLGADAPTVEAVREYLDRKTVPARDRPRRPARNAGVPVGTEERPQE